jgi:hypothetical protein
MDRMNQVPEKKKSSPEAKDDAAQTDARQNADALGSKGAVRLNKDVVLQTSERLPHLDKGDIKAYKALGSQKIATNLFALVCEKGLSPRSHNISKYKAVVNSNLAPLVANDKTMWDDDVERYCFVYENTLGQPLVPRSQASIALGWKPEMVMANIIKPMIYLLLDLRDKDLVHGEIWPGNMYDGGSAAKDKIRLGECLITPVSSQLPALYEPIERAMAQPFGRGMGVMEDDLYSLGVSLAVLMRSEDPLAGMSDEAVITAKIEKGSYTALMGKERFSGAVLELLRGLLYDDQAQRWTLDEVQAWMDGRRLSPKQSPKRIKASRPLLYNDKKYTRPELLANELHLKPMLTSQLIEGGELQIWLDRAVEDNILKTRMERTMEDIASLEKGDGYADRLSSRVAITLNPEAPIRYKNLSFMPDGFGKYFSSTFSRGSDLQSFIDILRGTFLLQIIRQKAGIDQSSLIARFDSCRTFINQTKIGSGIERCLYFLDSDCPCLSASLADFYVQSPEDLMNALEILAQRDDRPQRIIDRHIAAFLSVKDRKNIDPYVIELSSDDPSRVVLAEIKILATIQKRSRLKNFPNLAKWTTQKLSLIYEKFNDHELRESVAHHVSKMAKVGDLTKLAALLDDDRLYNNDAHMFEQAKNHFVDLCKEQKYLLKKLEERKGFGEQTGQQIASFVSLIISLAVVCIAAFVAMTG